MFLTIPRDFQKFNVPLFHIQVADFSFWPRRFRNIPSNRPHVCVGGVCGGARAGLRKYIRERVRVCAHICVWGARCVWPAKKKKKLKN
jgi:hypothetical protein